MNARNRTNVALLQLVSERQYTKIAHTESITEIIECSRSIRLLQQHTKVTGTAPIWCVILLYLTKSSCDALSLVGTQLIGDIGYINYILSPTVINIHSFLNLIPVMSEPSPPVSLESSPQTSIPATPNEPPYVSDDESTVIPSPNHVSVAATRLDAIHHATPLADIVPLTIFISMMTEVI
jgi:hypothetical protein